MQANDSFFKDGKFAVDPNRDGSVETDDNEFPDTTGGTIVLEQSGDEYRLDFTFELENGIKVKGSYSGDFAQA